MDWSYVAGYFDGEGHVNFHLNARGRQTCGLSWYNGHLASLETMRDFMQAGNIHTPKKGGFSGSSKVVHALQINRRADLLRVLDELIPRLIVKREQAERLREYLLTSVRDESPNFGIVAAVSTEQLIQWYHGDGKSFADIARLLGSVHATAVAQAFRVRGIESRPAGGSHLKGVPKSEETRQRMRESRRKMWEDPTFRAAQLEILSKGRAARRKRNE